MRTCPKCNASYDQTWSVCLRCGVNLLESDSPIHPVEKAEVKDENIAKKKENAEIRIGKYWLGRLGVISFVIGIGFFIVYTFQYIPLLLKIGIGYVAGALLLIGGNALEKKPNYNWFGKGFIGGGWVLLYFMTFAIHHIPQARIIENQFVDLVLLAIVALLMLFHLLKYKSQTIVAMALSLCFLTVGISEVTFFSLFYSVLLVSIALVIISKMQWHKIFLYLVAVVYITHLFWVRPKIGVSAAPGIAFKLPEPQFWLSFCFLTLYWILFNITPFLLKAKDDFYKNISTATILLNAFMYGSIVLTEMQKFDSVWRFYSSLSIGILYLIFAIIAKYVVKNDTIAVSDMCLSVACITASFPYKFARGWVNIMWLAEIPPLVYIGIHFNRFLYRLFAWILTAVTSFSILTFLGSRVQIVIFGRNVSERLLIGSMALFCFFAAKSIYKIFGSALTRENIESKISNYYTITGGLIFILFSFLDIKGNLLSFVWACGALSFSVIGFILEDKIFRYLALITLLCVVLRVIFIDLVAVQTIYKIILFIALGGILSLLSFLYAKIFPEHRQDGINDEQN